MGGRGGVELEIKIDFRDRASGACRSDERVW